MEQLTKRQAMNLFKSLYKHPDKRVLEEYWEEFTKKLFDDKKITRYQYGTWKSPFNK